MIPLTCRQSTVLRDIHAYITENGYSPSIEEIRARMGIRSTNGVVVHLKALERKGAIMRTPNISRSIVLTSEAKAAIDET